MRRSLAARTRSPSGAACTIALALVAVFTYGASMWGFPAWLRLPAFGVRSPAGSPSGFAGVVDVVRHALLPVGILAAVGAAGIARYAR